MRSENAAHSSKNPTGNLKYWSSRYWCPECPGYADAKAEQDEEGAEW